jgi:hypothetical protein
MPHELLDTSKDNSKLFNNLTFDTQGQTIQMKPVNPLRLAPAKREMQLNYNFKVLDQTEISLRA